MQLGMIGLGRMGANVQFGGHEEKPAPPRAAVPAP